MNNIIERIDGERIAKNFLDLVAVPSPTGSERAAVLAYRDMLLQAGVAVELDEHVPESPAMTPAAGRPHRHHPYAACGSEKGGQCYKRARQRGYEERFDRYPGSPPGLELGRLQFSR